MERDRSIRDLEFRGWKRSRRPGSRERWHKCFGEDIDELQVRFYAEVDADSESYTIFIHLRDAVDDSPTWVALSAEELDTIERAMNCIVE